MSELDIAIERFREALNKKSPAIVKKEPKIIKKGQTLYIIVRR